jgi:uncharacterized protein (UPF0332 family)
MSFDWLEYLRLAHQLVAPGPSAVSQEARLRSAISRAYYAAFKMAYNYLRDRDKTIVFVRTDVHSLVLERYKYSPDRSHREIGVNLDRLRRERNRADYDDSIERLPDTAAKALLQAEKIISGLAKL